MLILLSLVHLIQGTTYCDLFNPLIGGTDTSLEQPLDLNLNQNFAIGIWIRYTPGAFYWSEISGADDQFLVYYLRPEDDEFPPISFMLVLSKLYQNALIQYSLYKPGLMVIKKININKSLLDGQWIFSYVCYSASTLVINGFYYNPILNTDILMF